MQTTLFIIFGIFLHNNFPNESKKVTRDGLAYEAFRADAFRRITTHLINTTIVNKLGSCVFRCVKNVECVSFNFGNPFNGKHVCELLRTDKYNSRSSYVNSTDFHYFYPVKKCMDRQCHNSGSCYPGYGNHDYHCVCNETYGTNCEIIGKNCYELLLVGFTTNAVYPIDPDGQGSFPVYCDMTTDGGGWTVFQKRFDGSVNFNRGWQDYKTGFGNPNGEFWLGLDKIHRLTKKKVTTLRVELEDWRGNKGYAVYSSFSIADESDLYRLTLSGYSGTAGDSMTAASKTGWISNGMRFSTSDKDNDQGNSSHCAASYEGGWWFNNCYAAYLNGRYIEDSDDTNYTAMSWFSFQSDYRSLKSSQMKLKQ